MMKVYGTEMLILVYKSQNDTAVETFITSCYIPHKNYYKVGHVLKEFVLSALHQDKPAKSTGKTHDTSIFRHKNGQDSCKRNSPHTKKH